MSQHPCGITVRDQQLYMGQEAAMVVTGQYSCGDPEVAEVTDQQL